MGRPKKDGVDYFSHDIGASGGRTMFTLESRYGNDGYAFWFKLLEILGAQSSLSYDCNDYSNWLFLVAKTKVSEEKATEILSTLSQVDAIDKDLWGEKIIWVEKFSERLSEVFHKRGTETPEKPSFCYRNTEKGVQSVTESTQSIVKESKEKDSIVDTGNKSPKRKNRKPIVEKSSYGSQNNVMLTVDEYQRLVSEFSNAKEAIEFLSKYIVEKNYETGSHNLTIRRWVLDAVDKQGSKKSNTFQGKQQSDTERIMSL